MHAHTRDTSRHPSTQSISLLRAPQPHRRTAAQTPTRAEPALADAHARRHPHYEHELSSPHSGPLCPPPPSDSRRRASQEYCAGGSIASLLEKFGAFNESLTRSYLRMVLSGLHFLHTRPDGGIMHRDIKGAK